MADVWANSMACHPIATCQIAGCCHLANSMSWSQSYVSHAECCHRRIQRHVIPEPRITLQVAATWWIHCHDSRATCHIAGCSHLAKSMSWSCHIAECNNSIRHIDNRFSPYFYLFLFFKMQIGLWRAAAFVSSPIHLFLAMFTVATVDSLSIIKISRQCCQC